MPEKKKEKIYDLVLVNNVCMGIYVSIVLTQIITAWIKTHSIEVVGFVSAIAIVLGVTLVLGLNRLYVKEE